MKKAIVILLCLGMAFSAQAQFTQSGGSSSRRSSNAGVAPEPFNKLVLTYSPLSFVGKYKGDRESESGYNAIGLTYMHGSLLAKFPLYLEFGGGVQYTFYSKDNYKRNIISVNIPVNLLYRFAFNSGKLHLAPFTGIYGRINAWGQEKYESGSYSHEFDLFGDDGDYSRFQLGWSVGAQFDVSNFYVHVAYLTDVTNLAKESDATYTLGGVNIGVGFLF